MSTTALLYIYGAFSFGAGFLLCYILHNPPWSNK